MLTPVVYSTDKMYTQKSDRVNGLFDKEMVSLSQGAFKSVVISNIQVKFWVCLDHIRGQKTWLSEPLGGKWRFEGLLGRLW